MKRNTENWKCRNWLLIFYSLKIMQTENTQQKPNLPSK